jgi:hypothetical protein
MILINTYLMRIQYYFLIVLVSSSLCMCQSKEQNTPEKIITDFFEIYLEEGSNEALDFIFATNKWFNINDSTIINLKTQLSSSAFSLGKYFGYEKITTRKYGSNFLLYSYLTLYEKQPLRFRFVFYNVGDNWQLQNISFDIVSVHKVKDF